MKKLLITSMMLSVAIATNAKVISDEDTAEFKGTVKMVTAYGPPGFGENPKTDSKFTYPLLTLNKKFDFKDTEGFGGDQNNVSSMQVLWSGGDFPKKGCVIVKGTPMGAQTGSHKTNVVLDAESFKKCN